jgi:glutaredoxin-like protein
MSRVPVNATDSPVTVYWRPGCPYCFLLRFKLRRSGISVREVNIWEDPSGAAAVREIANGNEAVPTVTIGDVAMVNPSAHRVIDELVRVAPDLAGGSSTAGAGGARSRWRARRSR